MGLIQSVLCSFTICCERVLTWTCCAFLLLLLMFTFILLMIYGITVGYHYAQKELAQFAMISRMTTAKPTLRAADGRRSAQLDIDSQPIVRLIAVNRTEVNHQPSPPSLEAYHAYKPRNTIIIDTTRKPLVMLEADSPSRKSGLTQKEKEIAQKLIGRYRRSKNSTEPPFLRTLLPKNTTDLLRFTTT